MKLAIVILLVGIAALVRGENCVTKYDCIDVGCRHHTTTICENHICTCSPIKEEYRCSTVGDCQRHVAICNTQWFCLSHLCRCK